MKKLSLPVFLTFLLIAFTNDIYAQSTNRVIRFGLIADIQYADTDTKGTRFYRNSLKKLDECIADFNQKKVPFILNLGDVTDRNPDDLAPVLEILKKSKNRVYTTTGNHDYAGIKDNAALYKKLKMPAEYYSFKKGDWRFIMLNTNEVASYANVAGTWKEAELNDMLEKFKAANGRNAAEYNGGVSSRQLKWLEELLKGSERKGEKVLIFSHHPFGCAKALAALNDTEVMSLVSKYPTVKAFIAGHHHAGAFCENDVPCIVAEGMVETADQNAYGIVELHPDKLVLTGYGKMTSRVIYFANKSQHVNK